jgi:hypothetical protein
VPVRTKIRQDLKRICKGLKNVQRGRAIKIQPTQTAITVQSVMRQLFARRRDSKVASRKTRRRKPATKKSSQLKNLNRNRSVLFSSKTKMYFVHNAPLSCHSLPKQKVLQPHFCKRKFANFDPPRGGSTSFHWLEKGSRKTSQTSLTAGHKLCECFPPIPSWGFIQNAKPMHAAHLQG